MAPATPGETTVGPPTMKTPDVPELWIALAVADGSELVWVSSTGIAEAYAHGDAASASGKLRPVATNTRFE